jgi:hypothetical protein
MRRRAAPLRAILLAVLIVGGFPPVALGHASAPERPPTDWELKKRWRDEQLMRAIFGKRYLPASRVGIIHVDDVRRESEFYAAEIRDVTKLPDGRTIVIANGTPSDETGKPFTAHSSKGLLNVYVLRRDPGHWRVLARYENVDALGSSGSFGGVGWIELAPGRPGFTVKDGGTWQGNSQWVESLYALEDSVRSLGAVGGHSDYQGACEPTTGDCWEIDGELRMADVDAYPGPYRDILVDFSGKHYTLTEGVDGKDVEHLKSNVHESARYHFDGKAYVLVAGKDLVSDD